VRKVALVAGLVLVLVAGLAVKRRVDDWRRGYSNTQGAKVVHYSVESRLVGQRLEEVAVIPAGGGRRPLLVLLHGRADGSPQSAPAGMLSDALFAGLARLGRRAPVVAILNGGGHSYYHDRRDGRWGSMILDEAIPDAIRRFHTRGRVAIGGISMGGYGALHLAAVRPRRFCAVGGHSAALWTSGGLSAAGAFDDAEDFARNDVFAAARRGRYDGLPVWIDGGNADPFRQADTAFVSLLRAHGVRVTHHVWPGGHEGSYWHAHMPAYLRFYAAALAACRA
jgi:S-formylglutathione hydrolase FrmB